jgi:Ca2+-transporting ATPase
MKVFRNVIEDMAADSLRCVAIAYRLLDEMENIPTSEEKIAHWLPEDDLVLLAIVGLKACISSRVNIINVIFVILLLSVL